MIRTFKVIKDIGKYREGEIIKHPDGQYVVLEVDEGEYINLLNTEFFEEVK